MSDGESACAVGALDCTASVNSALRCGAAEVREREPLAEEPAALGGRGDDQHAHIPRIRRHITSRSSNRPISSGMAGNLRTHTVH